MDKAFCGLCHTACCNFKQTLAQGLFTPGMNILQDSSKQATEAISTFEFFICIYYDNI